MHRNNWSAEFFYYILNHSGKRKVDENISTHSDSGVS